MKEGLIVGIAVGIVAGAILVKNCPQAKKLLDDGEKQIKKEINKIKKNVSQKQN